MVEIACGFFFGLIVGWFLGAFLIRHYSGIYIEARTELNYALIKLKSYVEELKVLKNAK